MYTIMSALALIIAVLAVATMIVVGSKGLKRWFGRQIMNMAKSANGDPNAWKKMVGEYYTNKVNATSRKDAITLLEEAGLSIKPLTEKDWEWGKGSTKDYQKYSTYEEYLNGFVAQYLYGVN